MTNDQEFIAGVLRYCDGHTDNEQEEQLVAWVAEKFAEFLAAERPRFDTEAFMRRAVR